MSMICEWGVISCSGRTATTPPKSFYKFKLLLKKALAINSNLNEI